MGEFLSLVLESADLVVEGEVDRRGCSVMVDDLPPEVEKDSELGSSFDGLPEAGPGRFFLVKLLEVLEGNPMLSSFLFVHCSFGPLVFFVGIGGVLGRGGGGWN